MNHTASASGFSTALQEDGSDLRIMLAQLADDLEEFSQNQNMAAEGDLSHLWMATDVLRAMVKTSEDPATTRESFFEAVLDAADITELEIEEDSQPQTLIPFYSGIEYIRPRPKSMPKVRAEWQQSRGCASSPKPPSNSEHPYDPADRGDRPPIPAPPRQPMPRNRAGLAVAYPNGEHYWTLNLVGRSLESEIKAITAQAATENVSVPEIPGPRWNGRQRQVFVQVPWEGYGVWFDEDDRSGREYQVQVQYYKNRLAKYWKAYPPREGEFEDQAASENKNVDEKPGKAETRVGEKGSGPKDAKNRESTPVLGKRSRGLASDNNDNEEESCLEPSTPRPMKKRRGGPSLTVTIPPATPYSPLSTSPLSPLTPLPSQCFSPVGGPAPAPKSIPIPAPAVPDAPPVACARTTTTRGRATRRSAAPPPEPTRRSTRNMAKKSA